MAANVTPTKIRPIESKKQKRKRAIQLLSKLRLENRDRFETIAKMWLSVYAGGDNGFTIEELDDIVVKSRLTDELYSPNPKIRCHKHDKNVNWKCNLFGAPLTQEGIAACQQLIVALEADAVVLTEGLFRLAGSSSRQYKLRELLCKGQEVHLDDNSFTAIDMACTLKMFLNDLPEPLLLSDNFPVYLRISDFYRTASSLESDKLRANIRRLNAVRLLVQLLPIENRQLFQLVLRLLQKVTQKGDKNKMSALSLGTLFVPLLLHPRNDITTVELSHSIDRLSILLSIMIINAHQVFQPPTDLLTDVLKHYDEGGAYLDGCLRTPENALRFHGSPLTPKNNDDLEVRTALNWSTTRATTDSKCTTDEELAKLYANVQMMSGGEAKRKMVRKLRNANRTRLGIEGGRIGLIDQWRSKWITLNRSNKNRQEQMNYSRSSESQLDTKSNSRDFSTSQTGSSAIGPFDHDQVHFNWHSDESRANVSTLPDATVDLDNQPLEPLVPVLKQIQESTSGSTGIHLKKFDSNANDSSLGSMPI